MNLSCSIEPGLRYRSKAQIARVVTESWVAKQMYCAACASDSLTQKPNNFAGVDFACPKCPSLYQLKSRKTALTNRIVDAGYKKMIEAIHSEQVPNLVLLQYSPSWCVANLILIPSFFLTESAIEKRKPLSPTAERANWAIVGGTGAFLGARGQAEGGTGGVGGRAASMAEDPANRCINGVDRARSSCTLSR